MEKKVVTIKLDLDDIGYLYNTSTRSFYYDQADRFECQEEIKNPFDKDDGNYMYWMESPTSALLFQKVLKGYGHITFLLADLADENVGYVVMTNYSGNWEEICQE